MKGSFYPSWRYHRSLDPRVVKDSVEDKVLGDEWSDTPADFEKPEIKEEKPKKEEPSTEAVEPPAEQKPEEPKPAPKKRGRKPKPKLEEAKA